MIFDTLLKKQLLYLIGIIAFIYIYKPLILFKPNGKPRQYGIGVDEEGYKKTFYTFQIIIIISAIFVTFLT
jgi:hypothetical protein